MPSVRSFNGNLLAALLVWAVVLSPWQCPAEPGPFPSLGQKAPHARLKDLSGHEVAFPVQGKWNLVFYWSLFCHICIEEMPMVVNELARLRGKPCESFFISLDTEKMKKGLSNFVKRRNLDCCLLLEEIASASYLTADVWGVKITPSTFLIDPEGKIVMAKEGPFPIEELFQKLRELPPAPEPCCGSATLVASAAIASGPELR